MSYTPFLIETLKQVSQIANQNFGKVTGTSKGSDNNQVLTATDLEIGQAIIKRITAEYPEANIIDEEAGVIDKGSQLTWVVDPIDGTSNFANGVPTYGIMIGLLDGEVPVAGGVSLPFFDQIYTAEKGKGTFCNGQKVQITGETSLLKTLVAYGIDGHQDNPTQSVEECRVLAEIVLACRNLRSSNSVFDVAMLLKGSYGALANRSSKIWDNIAQQVLIEEAGGIYTNFDGTSTNYKNPLQRSQENFTHCAAAPALHTQMQAAIHKVKKS